MIYRWLNTRDFILGFYSYCILKVEHFETKFIRTVTHTYITPH